MVKILDCTTRDGGHLTNWNFEKVFITDLIKELNQKNVSYYEIGYRNHYDNADKGIFYNCTPETLKEYYTLKNNLKLGVMTDATRYSTQDFKNRDEDYIDFVRIACHPDKISKTLDIAREIYNKGYMVFVQLMDISNIEPDGYMALMNFSDKNIFESIYLADSYGTLNPDEIGQYFNKLRTLGYEKISFHAHNSGKNALANTLAAIKSGAYSVDTTKNGIGRSGGNLALDELMKHV